ncbi:PWWP domain-containing protein 2B-like [Hippopotamus amphibius kiboko]|uniref:PWWP domain-containing protein 2B-like n=1 Tax=Hippopotamus amphibius kiboko TaxID=575201 RepID=UPI00259517F0|nr:PWWP domain-containing protein 2B-like [Hippopotamus amphibius kiboko]
MGPAGGGGGAEYDLPNAEAQSFAPPEGGGERRRGGSGCARPPPARGAPCAAPVPTRALAALLPPPAPPPLPASLLRLLHPYPQRAPLPSCAGFSSFPSRAGVASSAWSLNPTPTPINKRGVLNNNRDTSLQHPTRRRNCARDPATIPRPEPGVFPSPAEAKCQLLKGAGGELETPRGSAGRTRRSVCLRLSEMRAAPEPAVGESKADCGGAERRGTAGEKSGSEAAIRPLKRG